MDWLYPLAIVLGVFLYSLHFSRSEGSGSVADETSRESKPSSHFWRKIGRRFGNLRRKRRVHIGGLPRRPF